MATFDSPHNRYVFFDGLLRYATKDIIRFHTPGHRGGRWLSDTFGKVLGPSIASIDVSDVLEGDERAPSWIDALEVAQQRTADLFGAAASRYLINGTSGGIHVAVMALTNGGPVMSSRASHLSVYVAAMLAGASLKTYMPDYDPDWDIPGPLATDDVLEGIREVSPQVYVETHPNYYGIVPPLGRIAEGIKQHSPRTRIIADEAHGSHFLFTPEAPPTALSGGAHVSVQSFHKTLGALTQASVLHIHPDHDGLIARIDRNLFFLQSTSASPILLSSLEAATVQAEKSAERDWRYAVDLTRKLRDEAQSLGWRVLTDRFVESRWGATLDPTRVVIHVGDMGWTGVQAADYFRRVHSIQVEMANQRCMVLLISPGNTEEEIVKVLHGLQDLEHTSTGGPLPPAVTPAFSPTQRMNPGETLQAPVTWLPLDESVGRISAEVICPYPPGIPVVAPGEEVSADIVEYLKYVREQGFEVRGAAYSDLRMIGVVA